MYQLMVSWRPSRPTAFNGGRFASKTSSGATAIDTTLANGERSLRAREFEVTAPQSCPMSTARSSAPSTVWMSIASCINASSP
jgi:hypothetical protein